MNNNPFGMIPWHPGSYFIPVDSIAAKPVLDSIAAKPVQRWPHRASYRTQVRDARRRRNVRKRGGGR